MNEADAKTAFQKRLSNIISRKRDDHYFEKLTCHNKKLFCLQYVPESLIHAEAGNKPFRPLRPPIHGLSKIFDE